MSTDPPALALSPVNMLASPPQLLQDRVPTSEIGGVNGAHSSICSAFEVLSYVTTLVLNRPDQVRSGQGHGRRSTRMTFFLKAVAP